MEADINYKVELFDKVLSVISVYISNVWLQNQFYKENFSIQLKFFIYYFFNSRQKRIITFYIMKDSPCKSAMPITTVSSTIEHLFSSLIANCVFNVFLSYTAITLNSVTIHAIRKTSSVPRPLKALLLSLAVSDLGVGLLVQPLYTSLLVKLLQRDMLFVSPIPLLPL